MAGNNISRKWVAEAAIDARGMQTGAAQAVQSAKGMEQALEGVFGRMGAALKFPGISIGMESLTSALSIQGVRGFMNQFGESATAAENLGFLNDQLGTSVEWLSALQTAAGESGIDTNQFSASIGRLQQTLGQASMGSTEAQRTFDRLGLSWQTLRSQGFAQTFTQVAGALANVDDRAERARIAVELFGREGGQRMLRMFQGGAAGINAAIADVQARGGFMTQADLDRLLRADQAMDALSTSWSNLWRDLNVSVAPAITSVVTEIGRIGTAMRDAFAAPRPQALAAAMSPEQFQAMNQAAGFGQGFGAEVQLPGLPQTDEEREASVALGRQQVEQAQMEVQAAQQRANAARAEADAALAASGLNIAPVQMANLALAGLNPLAQFADQFSGGNAAGMIPRIENEETQRARELAVAAQQRLEAAQNAAAGAAARLEGAENGLQAARQANVDAAEAEAMNADAARAEERQRGLAQAEQEMARTRQMALAARSPWEVMQARLQEIDRSGLNAAQRGRLISQALPQVQPAPLLGSLRADSSEVGAILQASMNPQIDAAQAQLAVLEAMRDDALETQEQMRNLASDAREMLALARGG